MSQPHFGTAPGITDASCEDDFVLPAQLLNYRVLETPEKNLMFAVLLEAWIALGRKPGPVRDEAVRWFTTDNDEGIFCCENVCHALGIDPALLRGRIFAAPVPKNYRTRFVRLQPLHHKRAPYRVRA